MMDSLEIKPGRRNAFAAGTSEAVGGVLLAVGEHEGQREGA
jgi:uncharacterized membrane protein YphA (DoxX/SURF4 family)